MSNIRVRTTPNGSDNFINVELKQKFDFIEILSLKISQEEVYRRFSSDYGVVVGRVTINNGLGVPNAKVSIFIPVDEFDKEDSEIFGLYPYEQVTDKNNSGFRYNLLSKFNINQNNCYTPIGSFFNKREIQDNELAEYVYCKYYKFTTTTNNAGDFMLFGVPVGAQQIHVDADISNIGILSQKPYDLIRDGANEKTFESNSKFKESNNLDTLTQLKTRTPIGLDVKPFWGDNDQYQIGITRVDVDLGINITPCAIFMGSVIGDSEKNALNKQCRPRRKQGKLSEMTTGSGRVEMIRKTIDGDIERFDIEGGEVIDDNGTWAYQVPMNLDYVVTDEFGDLIPTDDPNKGIPTRARVRFRVGMNMTGSEGRLRTRAKYLIPHNPSNPLDSDYTFDERTKDKYFEDLYWNKIYSVSNHIARVQPKPDADGRNFIGVKDIEEGSFNPFPFNKLDTDANPLYDIICVIMLILQFIVIAINKLILAINYIINILNSVFNISYINYLKLDCDSGSGVISYVPGISGSYPGFDGGTPDPSGNGWLTCQQTRLIQTLNVVKFDFYNDWVNGVLYLFLLKYKTKKSGKGREIFCELDCNTSSGVDNNNDGSPDNRCFRNYILDTCVYSEPQNNTNNSNLNYDNKRHKTKAFDETFGGYIKKDIVNDELYYAAYAKDKNYKLFSTKIINLGSVFDCDWQGLPKIYQYLVDTTYNNQPETKEPYDNNDPIFPNETIENGWNEVIMDTTCIGIFTNSRNCNNIKRLCELGMGIDEDRRDPSTSSGYGVDGKINNIDIENPWVRGAFAYLNTPSMVTIPLIKIDSQNGVYDYNDANYALFRDRITNEIWQYEYSYYFYFGLLPGKTSLQKMINKYFPTCLPNKKVDLSIVIDEIIDDNQGGDLGTGEIHFHVNGGNEPYTYQWVGPTYNGYQFICPDPLLGQDNGDCGDPNGDNFSLTNLIGGEYTLIVTDSNGNQASTTITVSGFNSVSCETNPSPILVGSDGKVKININGGGSPYIINIQGVTDPLFNFNVTTTNQNYCYGNCNGINDLPNATKPLPAGEYTVTVTDSGVPVMINGQPSTIVTQCSDSFIIAPPIDLNISVTSQDAECYGEKGSGQLTIANGIPPFNIEWVLTSTLNPLYNSFVGTTVSSGLEPTNSLYPGTYNITVTDLGGNIDTATITINEPQDINVTILNQYKEGLGGTESGVLKFNVNGLNPPYSVDILGVSTPTISPLVSNGNKVVTNLYTSNNYELNVTDNNGCVKSVNFAIGKSEGLSFVDTFSKSWYGLATPSNSQESRVYVRMQGGVNLTTTQLHFSHNNTNWITLTYNGSVKTPGSNSEPPLTISPFTIYKSSSQINGKDVYYFEFWINDILPSVLQYPFDFTYRITDNNQQDTYSLFNGKMKLASDGTNDGTQNSSVGTSTPFGFYGYYNQNNTPVSGNTPKGVGLTQL